MKDFCEKHASRHDCDRLRARDYSVAG